MGATEFVTKNFLILGLATVITLGLAFPVPGIALSKISIGPVNFNAIAIFVIFVVSGFSLDGIKDCLQVKAFLVGMFLVVALTPLLYYPVLMLGSPWVGALPIPLVQGMAIFCSVPTTLSSGVVLVTQAGGNVPLAILLTIASNAVGVLTIPYYVHRIFNFDGVIDFNVWPLLTDLALLVLFPLVLGVVLRASVPGAPEFVKAWKVPLTLCNNSCVLMVVWIMCCQTRDDIINMHGVHLALITAIAVGVHLVFLCLSFAGAWFFHLPEQRTLILMCSQKSLPVCVSVLAALPPTLVAASGVLAIPCVIGHASQLFIDAALVASWRTDPEKLPLTVKNPQNPQSAA